MSSSNSSGLLAFTESAQRGGKSIRKKAGAPKPSVPRYAGTRKAKGQAVTFDDAARAEYLTGFSKRKQARKEAGREFLLKKMKEEQLQNKKEAREARKIQAAENVKEEKRAFGLDTDSEDENQDYENVQLGSDGEEVVPTLAEEEYDTDEHHTQVVVEEFDPELEQEKQERKQAKSIAKTNKKRPEKTGGSQLLPVEALPPSSAKASKANAREKEKLDEDQKKTEPNTIQKRLHVSGLTQAFSEEELVRRFSSFGKVVTLDEWPGPKGVDGELRPFAYLTLETTGPQVSRCINLLNGSMWKGTKLRIGKAKPDWKQRHAIETEKRRKDEEEGVSNPKKRRLPPHIGVEVPNMQPVTEERVKEGYWGWKRTPAGHLIRPLHLRPNHPLPKPTAVKVQEGDKMKGTRRPRANAIPAKRAKRITIDPTRYGAVHITGMMLESQVAGDEDISNLGPGEWECDEIGEEDEDQSAQDEGMILTRLVKWKYVGKDGQVLHQEFARLPIRKVPASYRLPAPEAAPVKASSKEGSNTENDMEEVDLQLGQETEVINEEDLDPGEDDHSDAGSDLFAGFPSTIAKKKLDENYMLNVPKAPYDPDAVSEFSEGYQEGPASAAKVVNTENVAGEKSQLLSVLGSLFGQGSISRKDVDEAPAPIYTPYRELDDGEEDDEYARDPESKVLVVEQPAVEEESEESEETEESESSEESEDEQEKATETNEVEMDEEPAPAEEPVTAASAPVPAPIEEVRAAPAPEQPAKNKRSALLTALTQKKPSSSSYSPIVRFDPSATAAPDVEMQEVETQSSTSTAAPASSLATTEVRMTSLKDMFRPKEDSDESGAFSLLGGLTDDLDLELDEDLDFAVDDQEEEASQEQTRFAPLPSSVPRGPHSWFDPSPRIPFLFPTASPNPRSILTHLQNPRMIPLIVPFAAKEEASRTGANTTQVVTVGYTPFTRNETDEELQAKWNERKAKLTQDYKKRHREAIRKKKSKFIGGRGAAAAKEKEA